MRIDECSAMGCTENAGDDRKIVHLIRTTNQGSRLSNEDGVNLAFCRKHAEHFLREWAGLMTGTDGTDKRIYA
ncbi:hypothetical protein, partial [Rhodococcus baikonurensis]